ERAPSATSCSRVWVSGFIACMRGPGSRASQSPSRAGWAASKHSWPATSPALARRLACEPMSIKCWDQEPKPMVKAAKRQFVCQNCGASASRWAGKCVACGAWNTLSEETDAVPPGSGMERATKGRAVALETLASSAPKIARMATGLAELDRVTGGGVVPGSALLIGGEPGIGKSTLLLQLGAAFARAGRRAIYFSGEEAAAQVRLRAERLGLADAPLALACETNLAN